MINVFGCKTGQEEIDEVSDVLRSQWLGLGKKVDQFEKELAKRNGFRSIVMTDSCSNSLYTAIRMFNLPPGTEVILPSFTFVSCAHAVVLNNLVPVFCDVELNTMNVSLETIMPHITPKTGLIMVVHYAGLPVDVPKIATLGIPILEDAACAIDSKLGDTYCGGLGDVGCFSFDSMKNLSCGEGGAITSVSPTYIEKARRLRYCGISQSGFDKSKDGVGRWWETEVLYPSIRQMPNDVTAAIALAQLRKLDILQSFRKNIWDTYQNEFTNVLFTTPENPAITDQHSYFTYAIKFDLPLHRSFTRDKLAHYLLEKNIYVTLRYYPLHMMKIYKTNHRLKNTEILCERVLNLPIHPNMTDDDLDYIISNVKDFFK